MELEPKLNMSQYSCVSRIHQNHRLISSSQDEICTGVNGATHSDMECSPSLSLSSCFLQIFLLFFTQRATQATFYLFPISFSPHLLNSSSILSSPLTSAPPHLTALCLCSSLLPAAGLGHSVFCVGCVDFFWLRPFLIFCSPKFLFSQFSGLCRSYPALSQSLLPFQSPILSVLFPFFRFFYPSCFYCLRQTRNQCVTSSSSPVYVCVPVFHYRNTHAHIKGCWLWSSLSFVEHPKHNQLVTVCICISGCFPVCMSIITI